MISSRIAVGLVAMTLFVGGNAFGQSGKKTPVAVVSVSKGEVNRTSGGRTGALSKEDVLFEGDSISTGGSGQVQVHFTNGTILRMRGDTEVVMTYVSYVKGASNTMATVKKGSVRVQIKTLHSNIAWRTATPGGVVAPQNAKSADVFGLEKSSADEDSDVYVHYNPTGNAFRVAVKSGNAAVGRMKSPQPNISYDQSNSVVAFSDGAQSVREKFELGYGVSGMTPGNPSPYSALNEVFSNLPIDKISNSELIRMMGPLFDMLALAVPGAAPTGPVLNPSPAGSSSTALTNVTGGGPGSLTNSGAPNPLNPASPSSTQADEPPTTPTTEAGPITSGDFDPEDPSFNTGFVDVNYDDIVPGTIPPPVSP